MIDDHNSCEWVNVSSGTWVVPDKIQTAIKQWCVSECIYLSKHCFKCFDNLQPLINRSIAQHLYNGIFISSCSTVAHKRKTHTVYTIHTLHIMYVYSIHSGKLAVSSQRVETKR